MLISFAIAALLAAPQLPRTSEIGFTSHDKHPMFGKLTLPNGTGRHPVVIYVQTAEGATVDMKRPNGRGGTFNYFDLYRQTLAEMNIGFFSYEGRGVRMGEGPPRYEQIDWDVYNTSKLDNKVLDVLSALRIVKEQPAVDPARIYLMGASEGTLVAAEAASRAPDDIKGLILYAVLYDTLKDALGYMAGDGAFLQIRGLFDSNRDGKVSKEELTADAQRVRAAGLSGVTFEQLDADANGTFTAEDFKQLRKGLLDAISAEQFPPIYAWLKLTAAVSIPQGWLEDHFAHSPMWTFLSGLNIPVGLFHGSGDGLTPIETLKSWKSVPRPQARQTCSFTTSRDWTTAWV
jgi:pimeloyl-ACP methyl ester carboxylesterase